MTRFRTWIVTMSLFAAACTPQQVTDYAASVGVTIEPAAAVALAEHLDRDCLAQHQASDYVECAIADSWAHYRLADLGISLERWAQVAWCETRLNPSAVNTSSGAHGLYQHIPRFWPARADAAGWGPDWASARVNAFVSAWLAVDQGLTPWAASRHCWGGTP